MISVIVPVYNSEKYLNECIASICNQSYKDFEIIIVNDCSSDASGSIIEQLVLIHPNIVSITLSKNSGLSAARNAGLDAAKGEYVCYVDSDDILEKNYLEVLYKQAKKYNADLVIGDYREVDDDLNVLSSDYVNGKKLSSYNRKRQSESYSDGEIGRLELINKISVTYLDHYAIAGTTAWNKLISADIARMNRFKEGYIHEDEFWIVPLILSCNKIVWTGNIIYNYRIRNGSITRNKRETGDAWKYVKVLDAYEERINLISDLKLKRVLSDCYFGNILNKYLLCYCEYNLSKDECHKFFSARMRQALRKYGKYIKSKDKIKYVVFVINEELFFRRFWKMSIKKRILIVNDLLIGGGVEKLMYDLTWAMHDKYDITIMTDEKSDSFNDLYPDNVSYIWQRDCKIPKNGFLKFIYQKTIKKVKRKLLKKKLDNAKYDIAIAIKEGWKMLDVYRIPAIKKFCWVHTDYNAYYYTEGIFKTKEYELEIMKSFDNIVCVSKDIMESIKSVIGDPGNLVVKYNPIDIRNVLEKAKEPVVDVDSADRISKDTASKNKVRFVTVGRLNYQKGYGNLLEACHMLDCDGYEYEVLVIGEKEPWGDEAYRLNCEMKRLNIKNVKFLGGRKNPYKYMAIADWFISSSLFEGYSLVSQEAAILDVPMLLTDVSGVRELLEDNSYGIVMENSVRGIYEEMKRVIDNPKLHEYYKQRIMERKKIITYEKRLEEIEKMFM